MVNHETGTMAFNEFGISFVSDDIPEEKAKLIYEKMDKIMKKAQKEFNEYLDDNGFEAAMGVVIKKEH